MPLEVTTLEGDALREALPDIARLRIQVFREWPYLYDGDLTYERKYLSSLAEAEGAAVVVARDGSRIVGAATGGPIREMEPVWAAAFEPSGIPLATTFYCAESVLDPAYRGQGIGHRFFDLREAQARRLGMAHSCFCAVRRPEDHQAQPTGYRSLEAFWRKRGYAPLPGIVASYAWPDVGERTESVKMLQFWSRDL